MDHGVWIGLFAASLRELRPRLSDDAAQAIGEALWPVFGEAAPLDAAERYDRISDEALQRRTCERGSRVA